MFPFDDAIMFFPHSSMHSPLPKRISDEQTADILRVAQIIVICNDHQFCYNCNCLDEDEVFKISPVKDHHDVIK